VEKIIYFNNAPKILSQENFLKFLFIVISLGVPRKICFFSQEKNGLQPHAINFLAVKTFSSRYSRKQVTLPKRA